MKCDFINTAFVCTQISSKVYLWCIKKMWVVLFWFFSHLQSI